MGRNYEWHSDVTTKKSSIQYQPHYVGSWYCAKICINHINWKSQNMFSFLYISWKNTRLQGRCPQLAMIPLWASPNVNSGHLSQIHTKNTNRRYKKLQRRTKQFWWHKSGMYFMRVCIYLKASKEVNLPVFRTKIVVSLNISLLVIELQTLLPYSKICTKWLQGSTETSAWIMSEILLRSEARSSANIGQHRRKWAEVSSSSPQRQQDLLQLKLWLNLWSRKSENPTLILVKSLIPNLSVSSEKEYPGGRIYLLRCFLKFATEGFFLASSSRFFHASIVYGKKLFTI